MRDGTEERKTEGIENAQLAPQSDGKLEIWASLDPPPKRIEEGGRGGGREKK